jgi:hypothetical protein
MHDKEEVTDPPIPRSDASIRMVAGAGGTGIPSDSWTRADRRGWLIPEHRLMA